MPMHGGQRRSPACFSRPAPALFFTCFYKQFSFNIPKATYFLYFFMETVTMQKDDDKKSLTSIAE